MDNAHGSSVSTRVNEFRFLLIVKDLTVERSFYDELFRWRVIYEWSGGVMYDTGAATFELIHDESAPAPNGSSRIALSVPDVWTLYDEIRSRVELAFGLRHNSWGDTSFRIYDPAGFAVTLFTPDRT